MGQKEGIKIRALPRGDEHPPRSNANKPAPRPSSPFRVLFLGVAAGAALMLIGNVFFVHAGRAPASVQNAKIDDMITKSMQDVTIKHDMLVRKRELENAQFKALVNKPSIDTSIWNDPSLQSNYGVNLDTEDTSDRVYADLHADNTEDDSNMSPGDRLTAKLEAHKWENESERAERIQFVRNFIKSAYDHGYEVEIDQNLRVVGVHKITGTRKVNINRVIDRLAQEGL